MEEWISPKEEGTSKITCSARHESAVNGARSLDDDLARAIEKAVAVVGFM
jgi:hypothetical protein